jgi:hypothetical protein
MRCGGDAYTRHAIGGKNSGCGRTFDWKSAKKYEPNPGNAKMPNELNVVPPEKVCFYD